MDPLTVQNHLRSLEGVGQSLRPEIDLVAPPDAAQADQPPSFKATLAEYIDDVNHTVLEADQGMADLAAGRSADVHGTLIAMQKADLQLRLLVQVRNKVISAYEEIMRMQV